MRFHFSCVFHVLSRLAGEHARRFHEEMTP
jgi:hypothetical protein